MGDGRTVTAKVLALLGAFESGPPTRTLTELATAAQVPLPTAHRLVGELVEWGALRRDDRGRYRVGRRVWAIGQNAGSELRDSARRHLTDLFAATGEPCHLAIRDGEQALVIDCVYGSADPAGGVRTGERTPLHASAAGRVLLAHEAAWIRDAYVAARATSSRPTAADRRLADELASARRRGWAALLEDGRPGCTVAVPVLLGVGDPDGGDDAGPAVAAIGVLSPTAHERRVAGLAAALQQTARRIAPEARGWPTTRALVAAFTAET